MTVPGLRIALHVCLALALSLASCVTWAQGPAGLDDYRLFFSRASPELLRDGEFAPRNRALVERMAGFMPKWVGQSVTQFMFIALRARTCRDAAGCHPDSLLLRRVSAVMDAVRAAGEPSERIPANQIRQAFDDDLSIRAEIAPPPDDVEVLDLFMYVEATGSAQGDCSHAVLLFDPALPPTLGARAGVPALPLGSGGTRVVGRGALIQMAVDSKTASTMTVLWETPPGRFCPLPSDFARGQGVAIPTTGVTLHTIIANARDTRPRQLARLLDQGCRSIPERPDFLAGEWVGENPSRDIGHNVGPLRPGTVRPQSNGASTKACAVTLIPEASEKTKASR